MFEGINRMVEFREKVLVKKLSSFVLYTRTTPPPPSLVPCSCHDIAPLSSKVCTLEKHNKSSASSLLPLFCSTH